MNLARRLRCTLFVLTIAAASPPSTPAQETHAKVVLLLEGVTAPKARVRPEAGKPLWAGLLFRLDPGWHVYWQNAGDSGEPPRVSWQLPQGYQAGEIRWPTPVRLGSGSVIDYGYEGHVLLMAPISAEAGAKGEGAEAIEADVRYVVCREICIPGKAHLVVEDGPFAAADGAKDVFAAARAALPRKMPAGWGASATQDKDSVMLTVKTDETVNSATFFPLDADVIENSAPQAFAAVAGGFRLTLKKSQQLLKPAERFHGLIVLGPGNSYQISVPVSQH